MTTIYYLSATGNSLQAAKRIQETLEGNGKNVRLLSMPEALQMGEVHPEGDVGFVMPLHFFALPLLAETFFQKLDLQQADYTFAVMTCGWHYMSDAFHELRKIFAAKGTRLGAAFYIDTISIYLPLGDVPPKEKKQRCLRKATARTEVVVEKIMQHKAEHENEYLNLLSRLIHHYVQKHRAELDKNFQAGEDCNGCGLCAAVCPVENITLPKGKPIWQHHCTQCLGCLHVCPQKTIDIGKSTIGCRRYRHPEITVKELLRH